MIDPVDAILARFDDTLPLERAWTIPGEWYTDPRIAELERRRVFAHSWQLVGRTDQLAAPGAYVTAEVAGEPVLVVRGTDGALRGFFNVCRHHAAAVMTTPCGVADRLRCPYHGWTYDLEGKLRGVPEFDGVEGFDKAAMGLAPLAVATWQQLVFVHLDPDPAPLVEVQLDIASLQFCERREYTLGCNWKVFVDNYLDGGYHVPHLHGDLASILSHKDYTIETFERVCLQSSPITDGDALARTGRALYYWIYPNLMLNWYDGYLDTNLVIPLGVDRTKVVFDFYFADISDAAMPRNRESIAVSDKIQDEDLAICESVQRGLSSRAYRAGRLSVRREAGENLFHKLLAADLRRR
jgi:phenylpropionate dioxygenase-like ring-hydroxylating dioxygenase large terminal subunit